MPNPDPLVNIPPAIKTFALTRRFNGFIPVQGIALRIAPGQMLGLLGPNGAGKRNRHQDAHLPGGRAAPGDDRGRRSAQGLPANFGMLALLFLAMLLIAARLYPGLAQ